jgi:alkylhydroperoxidase family enzyme
MTFIETIPEAEATGAVQEMYETDRAVFGDLPNLTQAFSLRPEVYAAWRQLNGSIKAGMDLRRYELATLAAARRLRSSYCALAHGSVLLNNAFLTPDALRGLMEEDGTSTGDLASVDVAVMDLADKVADDATSISQADVDRLRAHGLSDTDILDIVLTAAARCFFSKALDALGAAPDAKYAAALDPALRDALTVGRPIATN